MIEFVVTFVTADRRNSREARITALDIDYALNLAIEDCPDDDFVAAIRQADVDLQLLYSRMVEQYGEEAALAEFVG